ncbi:MAG: hypothetical protein COB84_09685 [Rhodobacteraceae bacterium]|nr:MAG: hypothetical protein COB84_09685 [Paracoccaceae bacterium]
MQNRAPQDAVRLNMDKAIAYLGGDVAIKKLTYIDQDVQASLDPQMLKETVGDIVLARKDIGTSYHIAVVVDDAHQGITHVTRGRDLQSATPLHRLLQALLDLPTPQYHHHRLIRDAAGKRLAKRDDARAIRAYRDMGKTLADIRAMVGLA